MESSQIAVTGFAMMPEGNVAYELYKTMGCTLIIDAQEKKIINSSFTFAMPLTNEFLSSIIRGMSIQGGIEPVIKRVKSHFLAPGQSAVLHAIRMAYERFIEIKN